MWLRWALTLVLLFAVDGCASWRPDVQSVPSHALEGAEHSSLGRAFAVQSNLHPGRSGFQVMASGTSALAMRAAMIAVAERTIDLQYYSAGNDLTTDLLLQHLVAAAERGVRIRLLLDDIEPSTRRFAQRAAAAHAGIQVRLFNPFHFGGTSGLARLAEFAFDSERLNRRMHNKLWITDNAVAIVGSRNLADAYFDANGSGNFHDVDLLSIGPIVDDMSRAFDAYWNSDQAVPIEAFSDAAAAADAEETRAVRQSLQWRAAGCEGGPACRGLRVEDALLKDLRAGSVPLYWGRAQFIYDVPGRAKRPVYSGIEHGWMEDHPGGVRTEDELLIVSPYFVPSEAGLLHLRSMRSRGVRIAILTNSLDSTDVPAAHAGYARHRVTLVRDGIELYEMRLDAETPHTRSHRWRRVSPSSLHAKFIVQDRRHAIVGSLNQDPRSRLYNTEAWVAVDSPELAAELAALFDEGSELDHAFRVETGPASDGQALLWTTAESGKIVRFDAEPISDPWSSLWRGLLGVLIPEDML